jgi:hypothetical protein
VGDADAEVELEAGLLPAHRQLGHAITHGRGHAHRPLRRIGHGHRIVEEDHHAVSGEALERSLPLQDELAHLGVVLAQHGHDLFGLRRLREGGEAAQVEENHGDVAAVALEGILGAAGDDGFGELGGEEALEPAQALELGDLGLHALFEGAVELGQLVPELLDPEERADAGKQLRLVDGLGQEIVGPRVDPLDPLLRRIEGGDHDHGKERGGRVGAEGLAHLVARHLRHHHVEENEIRRIGRHLVERFLARGGRAHGIAARAEHVGEKLHVVRGVVHHQDARGIFHGRASISWTASRKPFTLMGLL